MRAVIITGGHMSNYAYIQQLIRADDYIIAADSGYLHAVALGLTPHVLLGDFDSLENLPQGVTTIRFPEKKDMTDTELAVDWARKKGFSDMLLLGAMGSRMDHTLSNILLLAQLLEQGGTGEIIDEKNRIQITDTRLTIDGAVGSILSLVPLSTCRGVSSRNLEYPLQDATLRPGESLGISNVISARPAEVSLTSGRLLVMQCRD